MGERELPEQPSATTAISERIPVTAKEARVLYFAQQANVWFNAPGLSEANGDGGSPRNNLVQFLNEIVGNPQHSEVAGQLQQLTESLDAAMAALHELHWGLPKHSGSAKRAKTLGTLDAWGHVRAPCRSGRRNRPPTG